MTRNPICLVLLVLTGCQLGGEGAMHDDEHHHDHDDATVRHSFDDVERWAAVFEDPARDAWQQPGQVLAWMELEPTARVADIGAATGYFPVRFARALPEGVVFGLDIEPALVNFLNLRALREELPNLVALVCTADDPAIPEPVDRIFICNTYHHIDARVAYFRRLHEHLRPGGRLVVVDFRPGELPVGPPAGHKLAAEQVQQELEAAGYELVRQEQLQHQYFLSFGLPAAR